MAKGGNHAWRRGDGHKRAEVEKVNRIDCCEISTGNVAVETLDNRGKEGCKKGLLRVTANGAVGCPLFELRAKAVVKAVD